MPADQFDHSDDDPSPADAGRTVDAGRPEDHPPPASAETNVEPAEPRTRQEYADHVHPQGEDSPSDPIPTDQSTSEMAAPEDADTKIEQSEERHSQVPSSEDQPSELPRHDQWNRERAQPSDSSPRDTDRVRDPDSPPAKPAGLAESNDRTADDDQAEQPAHPNEFADLDEAEPQDYEARIDDVLDRLRKAHSANLATDHQNTADPDNKQWTAERNRIHGEIVSDLYNRASAVPCERKAIIAGGLPGAGKTTILTEQADIDMSKYLTINPDNIKEVLARRDLIPKIEGLSPMEASDLAHEESSVIAKYLAHRAQAEGKNIIWDITMSRLESTQERIDSLRASAYEQIDAIFVDIPVDVSIRRTQARHREDQEKWQAGHGIGGRFIPPEVIRKQADPEWGSKNKKIFESIKRSINNWRVLDNGVDDRRARLVDSNDVKIWARTLARRERNDE